MSRSVLRRCVALFCGVGFAVVAAAAPEAASPTLRRIAETGVVSIGYRFASAPFSYLDARRRPIGYSIDICGHVVDAIRRRLPGTPIETRLVAVHSATRMPMLANGTIDLECGVTTNTVERQQSVAFSVTTFVAASRLLSRADAEVRTVDDLRDRAVATTLSTTSLQFLAAANRTRGLGMTILTGADDPDAFEMVRTGRAVAFAMDDVLLRSLLARAADAGQYRISAEPLTVEPYAIGLPRGDAAFKQLVDGVIGELFRSGEIRTIYRRWFESPIPHLAIDLKLPMSEALQRVIAKPTDSPDPAAYR